MTRTKKIVKFSKNKKYKKKPLDPTPWEELSKNIKGKFLSKFQTQNIEKDENQTLSSEACVDNNSFNDEDSIEQNSCEMAGNHDKTKSKKKKKKNIELDESIHEKDHSEISVKSLSVENNHSDSTYFNEPLKKKKFKVKLELDSMGCENSNIDVSVNSSQTEKDDSKQIESDDNESMENNDNESIENNDNESLNINDDESPSVEQLSKWQRKRLRKKEKMLSEKSDSPPENSKAKKLSAKLKLQRNKIFEKKRLERRKELGIMVLPKNFENRLLRIRKALKRKNLPPEEIKSIMRKERSKAQDEFRKSQSTQICFNCRKTGHLVANCPANEDNKAVLICIKCGSNEHKYNKCKKKISGFPFATCFICKGQGHISRDCPNNEHGIYPDGGKCSLCDSVNHLRKNCPTLKKNNAAIVLDTIDNMKSIDDEVMDIEPASKKIKSEKPKIVKF